MRHNLKQELILKAGANCFDRYGYEKTTLEDIGKGAGLNKASLYYYFKNKEEIFLAVLQQQLAAFSADLQAKSVAYPDVRRQIRFFLTERIRRFNEVLRLHNLPEESRQKLGFPLEEALDAARTSEVTFLTGLLRRANAENVLALHDPSATQAEYLFNLSEALRHEAFRQGNIHADPAPFVNQMEYWLKVVLR